MEMREVYSSVVSRMGYDDEKQELWVEWARGGRSSVYQGVPGHVADRIMKAPSIGAALRGGIQPLYTHRYE